MEQATQYVIVTIASASITDAYEKRQSDYFSDEP